MEKYIAIGDIHGCLEELEEVLNQAKNYPDHKLIFLGDYIDRGPNVNGVISRLHELKDAIFLYGNHEWFLIQSIEEKQNLDTKKKLLSQSMISEENYDWLKNNLILFYETENYIFSHSGLNPNKTRTEQVPEDYVYSYSDTDYKSITSKIVVHGHIFSFESLPQVTIQGNKINLDTGCALGGHLSAMVFPEMKIMQSKPSLNYLKLKVQELLKNPKKTIPMQL